MSYDKEFLKQVLSVPTKTYKEDRMIQFIVDWLNSKNIPFVVDEYGNIYATKQDFDTKEGFFFPCVVSHTDTVHNIDTINVRVEQLQNAQGQIKDSYRAYNDDGYPTGIGGDDKAGVFACLTLLDELPMLKAAFFVAEETGCHGSKKADKNFFTDVGYAIQFDSPENNTISEFCMGLPLFSRESKFFEVCDQVLNEHTTNPKYMYHPYTDVFALKNSFDFACINIPIGYYKYHTPKEYVVIEDVFNGVDIGKKIISTYGYNKEYLKTEKERSFL